MKTYFLKPGFELIFSISLMAILGLPPLLMAQNQKDIEIKIKNGDTTVNGKNIKDLSTSERTQALNNIRHMSGTNSNESFFTRRDTLGSRIKHIRIRRRGSGIDTSNVVFFNYQNDNTPRRMNFRYRFDNNGTDGELNSRSFTERFDAPMTRHERRNSQNFHYINIDKDGLSTHVDFEVSEVSNDDLKRMPYVEGSKIELTDLNLVPEFSTGKTLLMFGLPAKTPAEVKLTDNEGKVLWTEKALGGNFKKAFVFGLNGIYYLQIKQGHNICVKKIIKEE